jgi:hypothetical protein
MGRGIDLTGVVFGRLVGVRRVGKDPQGRATWLCECSPSHGGCGGSHITTCDSLRQGHAMSCGCLRRSALGERSRKHGHSSGYQKTSEYQTWRSMNARCRDPANRAYARYGGRGITVCDRWREDFAAFLADMGTKPSPRHSIDRTDNAGPYSPDNCRWATDTEQNRNTRFNVVIEYAGRRLCIAAWAEAVGLTYTALRKRIGRGWPLDRALGIAADRRPCAWPVAP